MKKTNCLFVVFAIAILLASSLPLAVSTAAAQNASVAFAGKIPPNSDFAQYLKNPKEWVNPIERKIREFKAADPSISNEDIIKKLAALGYGWNPESNAMWKGIRLSAEEQAKMPARGPVPRPGHGLLDWVGKTAPQRLGGSDWYGVAAEVNACSLCLGYMFMLKPGWGRVLLAIF